MAKIQVKQYSAGMVGLPGSTVTAGFGIVKQLEACLVTGFNVQPLASAVVAGNVLSGTTNSNHGFLVGNVIGISKPGGSPVDGEYRIKSVGDKTFTASAAGVADVTVSSGLEVKIAPAGWTLLESSAKTRAFQAPVSTSFLAGNNPVYVIDEPSDGNISLQGFLSFTSLNDKSLPFPANPMWHARNVPGGLLNIIASDRFCWVFLNYYHDSVCSVFCFGRFSDDRWGSMLNGGAASGLSNAFGFMAFCNDDTFSTNKWAPSGPISTAPIRLKTVGMTNKTICSTDGPSPIPDAFGDVMFSPAYFNLEGALRPAPGQYIAHHADANIPASTAMPDGRVIKGFRADSSYAGWSAKAICLDVVGPWHG